MFVLSRKNQESAGVGAPHDNECLLNVTVIEIQVRRVHPGAEAGQHVPIQRSDLGEETPVADQPQNRLPTNEVAANEAIDRWEDDGGGGAAHRGRHRSAFRPSRAAGLAVVLVSIAAIALATSLLMSVPAGEVPAAAGVDRNAAVNGGDVLPP